MKPPGVYWFNLALFPAVLGLCTGAAAWDREMQRTGRDAAWLEGGAHAATIAFEDDGPLCIMVQFGAHAHLSVRERVTLVAHESVHVWQHLRDHTLHTPTAPDNELEAYTVQWIAEVLLQVLEERGWVKL